MPALPPVELLLRDRQPCPSFRSIEDHCAGSGKFVHRPLKRRATSAEPASKFALAEVNHAPIAFDGIEQPCDAALGWPAIVTVEPPALRLGGPFGWATGRMRVLLTAATQPPALSVPATSDINTPQPSAPTAPNKAPSDAPRLRNP
jgi:hypothetical protein